MKNWNESELLTEAVNVDHPKELTHISLCAGYGGIDLGLRRVIPNIRTIAFSEIEAYAVANLVSKIEAGHLDAAPIWSDLKTFPFRSFRGKVDIISGGFPCQPFSAAGRRQGDEDPRHLWPYIVRGIEQSSPRMVFFENVEGIISSKLKSDEWSDPEGTPVLLHVLRELERLGYRATAGVFSASEVGAPHQRKRVFILGSKIEQLRTIKFKRSRYPSRRGQAQYSWEPSRVLTVGNADSGQQKSRNDKYRILSKATKEEKADINTRASVTRCSKFEQLVNANRTRLQREIPEEYTRRPDETNEKLSTGSSTYEHLHGQIKSPLGRCVDGSTYRVDDGKLYESYDNITDELRLLGNGVVPDTAARAFEVLWSRLGNADKYATGNESKDNIEKIN